LFRPTILSSEGTLQCIPFKKEVNASNDEEEYFIEDVYKVNIHILGFSNVGSS
jgi:thioredoxin-related protein